MNSKRSNLCKSIKFWWFVPKISCEMCTTPNCRRSRLLDVKTPYDNVTLCPTAAVACFCYWLCILLIDCWKRGVVTCSYRRAMGPVCGCPSSIIRWTTWIAEKYRPLEGRYSRPMISQTICIAEKCRPQEVRYSRPIIWQTTWIEKECRPPEGSYPRPII